jgi:hypothetical protein
MGSNHDHPVDVDPQALENARGLWNNFTEATKYGIIAVVIVLILMAAFVA